MIRLSPQTRELTKTYHQRNKRIRHLWSIGCNTHEIAVCTGLSESFVERIVFDSFIASKKKRVAA